MANLVLMPQMGISEESAILTQWHISAGDSVAAGDKIFSIETGKSAFDIESEYSGTVLALFAAEGDELLIKAPVCVIGAPDEPYDDLWPTPAASLTQSAEHTQIEEAMSVPGRAVLSATTVTSGAATGISPRARKLAEKAGVNPALAVPSGAEGRVIERDVRAMIESGAPAIQRTTQETGAPAGGYSDAPLSNMRRVIAKNMMASLQNTAQLTHSSSFDATEIIAYRGELKNNPELSGVTLTDMVLFAVTRTLPEFPALNSWLLEDGVTVRTFDAVHLAVAVDTPKGLMVPVIRGASKKTLAEISAELKALAEGCRSGGIAPDLLSGGSFTVSNLGNLGVEHFTPILNAPQTGIIGVNTITTHVREEDGALKLYPRMGLSLTYDHRAMDGAPASRFLQTLCRNLENFTSLLAK